MSKPNIFREIVVLKVDAKYELEIKDVNTGQVTYEDVFFFSYTSSPEVIIVKTNTGQRLRVPRGKVYETYEKN